MFARLLPIVLMSFVLLAGCGERSEPEAAAAGHASAEGAAIFQAQCTMCHGESGSGSAMVPERVDFKSRTWHEERSDEHIAAVIRGGVAGTTMPPFPRLSVEQVDALVRHIRSLAPEGTVPETAARRPPLT